MIASLARAYGFLALLALGAWALMSLVCFGLALALSSVMPEADAVVWSALAGIPLVVFVGWFGLSRRALARLHRYWALLFLPVLTLIWTSGTASYFRAQLDTWSLPRAASQQLALQSQREAALSKDQLQALTLAALPRVQQHLTEHAVGASTWYIQLPDAQTAYFTLNWQAPSGQRFQQLLDRSGHALTTVTPVQWSAPTRLGTWFFQLHFSLLGAVGEASRFVVAFSAVMVLWISASGLRLWLNRRRTVGSRQWTHVGAPWHRWVGLAALPSLIMLSVSALITMIWQLNPSPLRALYPEQPSAFYAQVLPWLGGGTPPVAQAPIADLQHLVTQHTAFAVGKVQVNQPGAANSSVLFTQAAASQVSNQLAQTLLDREGRLLQATPVSTSLAMQVRSVGYGLHQALFAPGWLRCALAMGSALLLAAMWFGVRQWCSRTTLPWYWQASVSTILPGLPLVMGLMVLALPGWSRLTEWMPLLSPLAVAYHGQLLLGMTLYWLICSWRCRRQQLAAYF